MKRRVVYSLAAIRTLRRMPANAARTVRTKITQYAGEPSALANNVKALKGEPGYLRLRIGDWRVAFSEAGEVIAIIRIAPRGSAYD